MSPFSTLEPAFETLNVKKFDGMILKTPWLLLKCYQYYNLIYRFLKLLLLWIHFTIKHPLSLMKAEPIKGFLMNNLGVYGKPRRLQSPMSLVHRWEIEETLILERKTEKSVQPLGHHSILMALLFVKAVVILIPMLRANKRKLWGNPGS
ncbi:hypothetical protein Droror1_Dr00020396 [Drosera rotundifolia]